MGRYKILWCENEKIKGTEEMLGTQEDAKRLLNEVGKILSDSNECLFPPYSDYSEAWIYKVNEEKEIFKRLLKDKSYIVNVNKNEYIEAKRNYLLYKLEKYNRVLDTDIKSTIKGDKIEFYI